MKTVECYRTHKACNGNTCAAQGEKTRGQLAYEADCAKRPTYHDGSKRKAWSRLGSVEKYSWERDTQPDYSRSHFIGMLEVPDGYNGAKCWLAIIRDWGGYIAAHAHGWHSVNIDYLQHFGMDVK